MWTVTTNNVPRDVIYASELTESERAEFDYLNWEAIDAGNDGAAFFRYKGQLYDLGEFEAIKALPYWDGIRTDSFFSAIVVKYLDDLEHVIVGLALS